ncbi:uncharacterized protein LOC100212647 [Hydra vulgaris]|uniref:uncharacterized protein LOC100212647 n=1 Tax=Hydra vulgaris TaxID=6087 RepID=UPI0032E9FD80
MENYLELYFVSMITFLKVSNGCNDGWFEYGRFCYFFQNKILKRKSWNDALLSCQDMGAHLLSIEDQAENTFIKNILKDDSLKKDNYWIGLNDDCNIREFKWSDNKYLQFSNWLPNKPDNLLFGENCVKTNINGWDDYDCNNYDGFICKSLKEKNDSCANGWLSYKNYCYLFQNEYETFYGNDWIDSYSLCRSKGGNLLSIEDQEENSFITSILESDNMIYLNFWIGLNYLMSHKRFVWSDQTKWNLKFPIETILNETSDLLSTVTRCVVINAESWNAHNCSDNYGYICKVKKGKNNHCASDWFEFNSYCYYFQSTADGNARIWEQSYFNCLEKGGNLLSISDETENAFILNILKNRSIHKDKYWIGLTDRWYHSWFLWSDNTYPQYMYSKFSGLFEIENKSCVIINKTFWEIKNCNSLNRFICKSKRATNNNCAEGWIVYKKYCYFVSSLNEPHVYTWMESFSTCQSKGGNLLSIENQEENQFIQNNLIKDNSDYWIGLNKLWNYKKFVWSDNTFTQFFNWRKSRPHNYEKIKYCVEMNSDGWNDEDCSSLNGFICKAERVNLEYVNHKDEFILTKGFLIGTLKVLKKEHTISFNLKPKIYSKGLKSVLQLITTNNSQEYSDKVLSVWFHEDGSGRLVIQASANGNSNCLVKTNPLNLGHWSFIKIYQWLFCSKYWFAVDVNGKNIHQVENCLTTDFKEIMVYVSNLSDDAQNGSISDLLINNGKPKHIVGMFITPLVKGKLIAEIPILEKEYFVSLDFCPIKFELGSHNVIHFTIGSDHSNYGDKTPGIWSHSQGNGVLEIASSINGYVDVYTFSTNAFEINQWSNIVICQVFNGTFYIYTIIINENVVYSVINYQAQSFVNVKVYASNPWTAAQNGTIKNLFVVNGNSTKELKPIVIIAKVSTSTSYPSRNRVSVISLAILVPVLTVLVAVVFVTAVLKFRKKKYQTPLNLNPFTMDQYIGCNEISPDEWEIFPEDIIKDKKIGEGAFGTVFNAKLSSTVLSKKIYKKEKSGFHILENTFVAVKYVKDCADPSELKDFSEEINLMKEIEYHKNIVNLIGCSTIRKPLCLIVEYMEHGDLLNFLRKRRTKFCAFYTDRKSSVNFMYTQGYQQSLKTTTIKAGDSSLGVIHNGIPSEDIGIITPDDLLRFAWQVASGMEFLSFSKLVHRDLAARNILVGSGKTVKISDFGLTRKINDELNYMSKKKRRLPVKWMSIEAIYHQLFTSFSDVWAYGVVLFEIITLGGTPYPGISNRELLSLLKSGYRMEKPENCSETMYDIMLQCWNEDPLKRPTFTTLRDYFDEVMSQGGCYLNFEFNENTAPLFLPLETDNDEDSIIEDEIFQYQVKSIEEIKKLRGESILPLNDRYTSIKIN